MDANREVAKGQALLFCMEFQRVLEDTGITWASADCAPPIAEELQEVGVQMSAIEFARETERIGKCLRAAGTVEAAEACIGGKRILPRPPLEISARELIDAYAANEVAADQEYKGRHVIVSGVIDRVAKEFGDGYIIIRPQDGKRYDPARVQCKVPADQLREVVEFRPGEPIRAGGCVSGSMMGQVFIEPCGNQDG